MEEPQKPQVPEAKKPLTPAQKQGYAMRGARKALNINRQQPAPQK